MQDSSRNRVPPAGTEGRKPRLARWQAAREVLSSHLQALPEPSAGPPPRLGRRGRIVSYSLAALLLMSICVLGALHRNAGSSSAPAAGSPQPAQTASVPISSPTAISTGTLQDPQAAAFLAAYFSWDARDTDSTYAQRWQPYVAPPALPALVSSEPLLTLDHGNDVAARSPMPAMPPQATPPGTTASMVVWTIQVLPEGGEGAAWLPRQVRAALSLMEVANGTWMVSAVVWSQEGTD
jgi:hypothetical protein